MNAFDRPRHATGRGWLFAAVLVSILGGFGLAWVVLVNPFELRVLEQFALVLGAPADGGVGGGAPTGEAGQLWTCGMHSHVLEDSPGQCPICQMNLVPVRNGASSPPVSGGRTILFYRNPMNPEVTSPVPAQDNMGMDYLPVYADEADQAGDPAAVAIDPAVVRSMGVVTEKVTRGDLSRTIRTIGYLDYDQEKMVSITSKYEGFVEKVYVNYLGQEVRRGDPLFEIYSPDLVQTEQEFLSSLKFARRMQDAPDDARRGAEALVEAARARLAYWDVTPEQVARLEETGQVFRTLPVVSPMNGLVMKRLRGLDGMAIRPGLEVLHIADLSTVWLNVEVFEDQLPWLQTGSPARVSFSYLPGEEFEGRIRFIEPEVSEKTRSVSLTLEVPNPTGRLRAGMYATVEFEPLIAPDTLSIPSYAVLRTGTRDVVVVRLEDGRYSPREVTLGPEGNNRVQVLAGLAEGEAVVTSSQFLIDSESNLREAINKMISRRPSREP